jgi:hypothetical protein
MIANAEMVPLALISISLVVSSFSKEHIAKQEQALTVENLLLSWHLHTKGLVMLMTQTAFGKILHIGAPRKHQFNVEVSFKQKINRLSSLIAQS